MDRCLLALKRVAGALFAMLSFVVGGVVWCVVVVLWLWLLLWLWLWLWLWWLWLWLRLLLWLCCCCVCLNFDHLDIKSRRGDIIWLPLRW